MKSKKSKLAIAAIIICVIIFCVYYYFWNFRLNIKLVYQYNGDYTFEQIATTQEGIDGYLDYYPELKDTLGKCLDGVNQDKYYFLVVNGGEIESLSMRKDKSNPIPYIKYKRGIPKNTVSYYLVPHTRFIDFIGIT